MGETKPKRIERKPTKGWKMPPNTVYVGRPTKWGNVAKLGSKHWFGSADGGYNDLRKATPEEIVMIFRRHARILEDKSAIEELRGKDLACWCPLDQPCHADVLLELANGD